MPRCATPLLLLMLALWGPAAPGAARAQGTGLQADWDSYRRGRAAFDRGALAEARGDGAEARAAFAEAAALLRRAQAALPGRGDVEALLGEALLRQGQAAAAYVQLSAALRAARPGEDLELRWALCRALQGIRQTRRALTEAQALLAAAPEHPQALGFAAERAVELGEDEAALGWLRRHLALGADAPRRRLLESLEARAACVDRAAALQRARQLAPALAEARRCVELAPRSAAAQSLRAALALQAGELDEAVASARLAGGTSVDRPTTTQAAAGARPARGAAAAGPAGPRADQGTPATTVSVGPAQGPALAARDTLAQALLRRGLAALGAGRGALPDLREAQELRGDAASSHALGLGLIAAGQAAAAADLLRPLAEAREAEAPLLLAYARALREARRPTAALPVLERARAACAEPLCGAAIEEMALCQLQLDRPAEAARLLAAIAPGVSAAGPSGAGFSAAGLSGAEDDRRQRLLAVASLAAGRQGALGAAPRGALAPLQAALRLRGRLDAAERAEAEILLAAARLRSGQEEDALRRLVALPTELGAALPDKLLGPGGLDALTAVAALGAGQLQVGAQRAARALPRLGAEDGRWLQAHLAAAQLGRAAVAYQRGEYDRAQALLRGPQLQAPGTARLASVVAYDLGVVLLAKGRPEEALQQWARLDVKALPEKWIGLGTAQEASGDRRGALESYRRYLQAGGPLADRVRRWVEAMERFEGAPAPRPVSEADKLRGRAPPRSAPRREVAP